MHLRSTICAAVLLTTASSALQAQQTRPPIDTYIHNSWDALQRSMSDCASFPDSKITDTKLANAPVLYLPDGVKIPAAVKQMQDRCHVTVDHLPKKIRFEGDLLPEQIAKPGLLYLPNPYVVPGGRFNEMYGWDSYFILLGELADGRVELARGTVENFLYEIDNYGAILNANRTYYLTRSQPPFLSSMVLAVYRAMLPSDPKAARAFLKQCLPYLLRDHDLWTMPPHLAGTTGLSRYYDLGHGPVPEMQDDSTYYLDIIHWLEAHPTAAPSYLEPATSPDAAHNCGTSSASCLQTQADGRQLSASFFLGDRAMRESGFDPSFRFGPFSGSTQDYAPICLNALLYKYEHDMAFITATLGDLDAAVAWSSAAGDRLAAINQYQWDDAHGLFVDYNFVTKQPSTYRTITTYYALWAGIATPDQAKRLVKALPLFEREGGLVMSTETTGLQWDAPYGWAPTNWLAVDGLARYGYRDEARRIATKFMASVDRNYQLDGTIREKYNMDSASAQIAVSAGYKANVIGFGWTNAVYEKMRQLLAEPAVQ
jgi:alpha,alpha-trehalase